MPRGVPVKYWSTRSWERPTPRRPARRCRRRRGDAHLGHHLQDALAERLDQVPDRHPRFHVGEVTAGDHVLDGLEGQVGVDRRGAVAERAGRRGAPRARHRTRRRGRPACGSCCRIRWWWTALVSSRRRDRRLGRGGVAVGQHDDAGAVLDRLADVPADLVQPGPQRLGRAARRRRTGPLTLTAAKPGMSPSSLMPTILASSSLVMTGNGRRELAAARPGRVEQVALRADGAAQAGDELLADRVQRRVGDLGEQLGEVVEEQPRPLADSTATGVSVPIDPIGSAPARAIGATRMRSSSSV